MDPSQLLFDSIGKLTGGLITDIQTAMVALLAISFIVMGIDLLKDKVLLPSAHLDGEPEDYSDEEVMSWLYKNKERRTGWEKDLWRKRYNDALKDYDKRHGF